MKSAWYKQVFSKCELPSPKSDRDPGIVLGIGTPNPNSGYRPHLLPSMSSQGGDDSGAGGLAGPQHSVLSD